ncbi:hypothetical protein SDC9_153122 [bioreactor metagenome]|uniref:Uncharacterized protein n=1 Tax=bioreactor metagenome TaxID=1076179 RepID=A0A645EV03_9ZZZZ
MRLPQRVGKKGAGADHAGENVIGGAVENSENLIHPVGAQALRQRMQHWDAAAHTGFKQVVYVVLLGQLHQLPALFGHQLLVGGHHMLSRRKRPLCVFICRLYSANCLHHHADFIIPLNG